MKLMAKDVEQQIIHEIKENLSFIKKPDLEEGETKEEVVIVKFIDSKNAVDETASRIYMNKKLKKAEELLGDYITTRVHEVDIDKFKLHEKDGNDFVLYSPMLLSLRKELTGKFVIVQKPLPKLLDDYITSLPTGFDITEFITDEEHDIDCICNDNLARMLCNDNLHLEPVLPCTVAAVRDLLVYGDKDEIGLSEGRKRTALVIGRSLIVGKPMMLMLMSMGFTVTVAHSKTSPKALKELINSSDLIVSAVGKANLITKDMISEENLLGKILIDVGINKGEDGKICGDIDKSFCDDHDTHFITPVPGGVGPLTVLNFVKNILALLIQKK